jgi:hypothetical protein
MPREMLKLRKGDSAIMIKADGSVEMAGVNDKPLMDDKGMILPVILFAAVWAKKDQNLLNHMVENFKNCVREGYFGPEAQSDFKQMEIEGEKNRIRAEQAATSGAVTTASGAVTTASGAVTFEPTISQEEFDKHKEEEKRLEAIAEQGQDPRVLRQQEMMKKGAKSMTTKPYEGHLLSDTETADKTVGTITIDEENQDNEDK